MFTFCPTPSPRHTEVHFLHTHYDLHVSIDWYSYESKQQPIASYLFQYTVATDGNGTFLTRYRTNAHPRIHKDRLHTFRAQQSEKPPLPFASTNSKPPGFVRSSSLQKFSRRVVTAVLGTSQVFGFQENLPGEPLRALQALKASTIS